ncbi:MFS transporter [Sinomonas sp. P10A9]|uniref:MFS transporter n=1 Tax=Sinomonas puerhi TaxID=3238584 RepID=A0AB39KZT8_9MICC
MASTPLAEAPSLVLASAARKVMTRLLPVLVIAFIINYIDRVNVGFVASHLKTDLGIGAAAYGLGAGLFFVGYAVFEVPSNMLLHKFGAKVWITRIMITWGIVAAAMALTTNEAVFYILRFLLGVAEAGFFPGCVLYIATWLPAAYRGKAMAILLTGSAVASIIAGPITGGLLMISGGGLHGWQWMFIIEGLAAVVLSAVTWFALVNSPEKAKWLSDPERAALRTELDAEQADREDAQGGKVSVWKLLADTQILLFCFIYFAIQLVIYAATFWLPTIIKQMGKMDDFQVGLWNTIPWVIAIIAMYVFAGLASKRPVYQRWVAFALVLASIGMFVSTIGGPVIMYIGICIAALGFKSASSLFWPIPQSYFDVRIAAAGIALINSIGNLGGFVAPSVFGYLQQTTGSVVGGLYGLAVSSIVAAGVVLALRMKKRKAPVGAPVAIDPVSSR